MFVFCDYIISDCIALSSSNCRLMEVFGLLSTPCSSRTTRHIFGVRWPCLFHRSIRPSNADVKHLRLFLSSLLFHALAYPHFLPSIHSLDSELCSHDEQCHEDMGDSRETRADLILDLSATPESFASLRPHHHDEGHDT